MRTLITTTLVAGLAALCVGGTATAMQDATSDILQDYNQRLREVGEQSANNEQRISEWSIVLERLIGDSRLTQAERAVLELPVRCAVTHALDQENGWLAINNADTYQAVRNILDLNVVSSETINNPTDQHYAWQAAECLWDRHVGFERMAAASDVNQPHIRIGLENAARQTLTRAMTLYERSAESVERFSPEDFQTQVQARGSVSDRYFQYAIATKRLSGPFSNTQPILDRANAYSMALLQDIRIISGGTPEGWFTVKTTQIAGNLAYGASDQAARIAVELVDAFEAAGNSRDEAIRHVTGLAQFEARSTPSYVATLNRLLAE
ncbi:hypothetical protein [Maricaulis sp.]|uniref:hypothetical protein n=1 Tax=Maricaulis sp. TaxID=1486257 RepID=UPI003A940ACE